MWDNYSRNATVLEWIDGDTVRLRVDLLHSIRFDVLVRVFGLETPEINSKDPEVRAAARAAKEFAISVAPPGSAVGITYRKTRGGEQVKTFGRHVATVTLPDGRDYANACVKSGHGRKALADRGGKN